MGRSRFQKRYGPWALVTGASDGIGLAMARDAARRGLHVVLVARRHERLAARAEEIERRWRVQTRVVAADLADPGAPDRLVDAVSDLEVGLVIQCAGFGASARFSTPRARTNSP